MKIGAHLSISKGLAGLINRAQEIDANCVQLFVSPPRNWNPSKFSDNELINFGESLAKHNLGPNFLHSVYLVNLGTTNPEVREKAINSIVEYLHCAKLMQAQGVVVHTHKPDEIFISAIDKVLARAPIGPLFLVENSATNTVEQTLELFTKSNSDRLGLCLDTCHLFAAGYDINRPEVIEDILNKIETKVGLDKLKLIHTNDAKEKLDSKRDHHENIGKGKIGLKAFELLINHPKLKNVSFVCETPGLDGNGPDEYNIKTLRSLIK